MAQLKSGVLGDLSGKLGDTVYYMRNKKQILAKPPIDYPTRSAKVKTHRKKFSGVNYFAKTVYRTKLLQDVWRASETNKMEAYNKLLSLNSKHFENLHPTLLNVITPEGLDNPVSDIVLETDKLKVKLLPETGGTLVCIIVPYNSSQTKLPNFEIINMQAEIPGDSWFEISLEENTVSKINNYPDYIIFSAVVNIYADVLAWTKSKSFAGKV